jgi:hypothetical protein
MRLELDGDGKQKRRSVTIYVDSIRHSAAGRPAALRPLVSIDLENQD